MARKARKGKVTKVDMAGVQKRKRVDSGDYAIRVSEVTDEKGDAGHYFGWEFDISRGDTKGAQLYYNTSTTPKALWNLRSVLEAFGEEIPDGVMELTAKGLSDIETEAGCTVELGTFEGKPQSKIVDIFPFEDLEEPGEAAEEESEEEGEGEDVTAEDVKEMDKDELDELIDDRDLDVDLDDIKGIKKQRKAVAEALESGGEETTYTTEEVMGMKKKALEGLIEEHDLEVELTGKLRKDRKAVIEALEEEDLIEDKD